VQAFTAAKRLCDRHTPKLEQETLAEFISTGAYERHLRRARRANAARRPMLLAAVEKYLGNRVAIAGDGSGARIALWPHARISEEDAIARAASHGVGVYGFPAIC
jgi:GntR family transcriptional regulator/MocR family aminotransferase